QGVQPERSDTKQIIDRCGMLETYAEVDKALADLGGETSRFRMSEEKAFIEGLGQTMASSLFYASTATEPEKFDGFSPRFNSTTGEFGPNIIDAGGEGSDNTSVWLVVG